MNIFAMILIHIGYISSFYGIYLRNSVTEYYFKNGQSTWLIWLAAGIVLIIAGTTITILKSKKNK